MPAAKGTASCLSTSDRFPFAHPIRSLPDKPKKGVMPVWISCNSQISCTTASFPSPNLPRMASGPPSPSPTATKRKTVTKPASGSGSPAVCASSQIWARNPGSSGKTTPTCFFPPFGVRRSRSARRRKKNSPASTAWMSQAVRPPTPLPFPLPPERCTTSPVPTTWQRAASTPPGRTTIRWIRPGGRGQGLSGEPGLRSPG